MSYNSFMCFPGLKLYCSLWLWDIAYDSFALVLGTRLLRNISFNLLFHIRYYPLPHGDSKYCMILFRGIYQYLFFLSYIPTPYLFQMTPKLTVYPSLCLCLCVTHTCTYVHTCIITQVINRLATDMEKNP